MKSPRDRLLTANRLTQHLLEWGGDGPVVLLLHGFLEHAHVWDWVAGDLAQAGYHVFALDWRGHGDSEWIGPGGYYHFADYTADLAFVVRELGGRAILIGHSMGGNAALIYAGTEPNRVMALVSIEGIGPTGMRPEDAPTRFEHWVQDLEQNEDRHERALTLAEATARLRRSYSSFSEDAARHMVEFGTRENGHRRFWKFDPLHQTRSPQPYYVAQAEAFWRRICCPVLYIDGTESSLTLPESDVAERLALLRARRVTIEGSGHHPHLEKPGELLAALTSFLAKAAASHR